MIKYKDCKNCKSRKVKLSEEPCRSCLQIKNPNEKDNFKDNWAPMLCSNCVYRDLEPDDYPCSDNCFGSEEHPHYHEHEKCNECVYGKQVPFNNCGECVNNSGYIPNHVNIINDCFTCKHLGKGTTKEPCYSCKAFDNWEPKSVNQILKAIANSIETLDEQIKALFDKNLED